MIDLLSIILCGSILERDNKQHSIKKTKTLLPD